MKVRGVIPGRPRFVRLHPATAARRLAIGELGVAAHQLYWRRIASFSRNLPLPRVEGFAIPYSMVDPGAKPNADPDERLGIGAAGDTHRWVDTVVLMGCHSDPPAGPRTGAKLTSSQIRSRSSSRNTLLALHEWCTQLFAQRCGTSSKSPSSRRHPSPSATRRISGRSALLGANQVDILPYWVT